MKLITGKQISEFLESVINKEVQEHEFCFDLTAKSITQLEGVGKVDFGGKEFEWGQRTVMSPKRIAPDDSYGWWKLSAGEYIIRLNESIKLPQGYFALVAPHERIVQNGCHHPNLWLQGPAEHIEVLLCVPAVGINIKENARISYLMAFQI